MIFYGAPGLDTAFLEDCFARHGGKFGQAVHWLFQQKGQILISKWQSGVDENTLVLEGLGAGAEDVRFDDGDLVEILTKPRKLQDISDILELEEIPSAAGGASVAAASLTMVEDDAPSPNCWRCWMKLQPWRAFTI